MEGWSLKRDRQDVWAMGKKDTGTKGNGKKKRKGAFWGTKNHPINVRKEGGNTGTEHK